jgi:cell wall-associated NlpC family hydrolase
MAIVNTYTPSSYTTNTPTGGSATTVNITQVTRPDGTALATLTQGARTVAFRGRSTTPQRTFSEDCVISYTTTTNPNYPCAAATLTFHTNAYVRLLPQAFNGQVTQDLDNWLIARDAENADVANNPDIIARAMSYLGANANYGPVIGAGSGPCTLIDYSQRGEFADFNDYLGIDRIYTYANGTTVTRKADPDRLNCLDCSGYVRMIYGHHGGLPLEFEELNGQAIPRRSYQIYQHAPAVTIVYDTNSQVTDMSRLLPGDLVFFNADTDSADELTRLDHIGIYLDRDTSISGQYRFISSRKQANGPTFADTGGRSSLDGTFFYQKAFRAVRRL